MKTPMILAIDPGPEVSAFLFYQRTRDELGGFGIMENEKVASMLEGASRVAEMPPEFVIEMIASYGMAVGAEVFETCVWIGRFEQAWGPGNRSRLFRREVKLHLCGSPRGKDSNIRQALIDRYGPGKAKAVGLKNSPGPLFGVKKDIWAALAVAVTFGDRRNA